ncbi:MAG TPA: hypothetical protein VML95_02125 [Longimicrobiales bacterium]|nr:hypothetical protein [Longimicrobiales bacterium]
MRDPRLQRVLDAFERRAEARVERTARDLVGLSEIEVWRAMHDFADGLLEDLEAAKAEVLGEAEGDR